MRNEDLRYSSFVREEKSGWNSPEAEAQEQAEVFSFPTTIEEKDPLGGEIMGLRELHRLSTPPDGYPEQIDVLLESAPLSPATCQMGARRTLGVYHERHPTLCWKGFLLPGFQAQQLNRYGLADSDRGRPRRVRSSRHPHRDLDDYPDQEEKGEAPQD